MDSKDSHTRRICAHTQYAMIALHTGWEAMLIEPRNNFNYFTRNFLRIHVPSQTSANTCTKRIEPPDPSSSFDGETEFTSNIVFEPQVFVVQVTAYAIGTNDHLQIEDSPPVSVAS